MLSRVTQIKFDTVTVCRGNTPFSRTILFLFRQPSGLAIGTPLSLQPFTFLPEETRDLSTVSALRGKGRG